MGVVFIGFYLGVSVKMNRYIYMPRFSMNTQCEALYMIKTGWYWDEVHFILFPSRFRMHRVPASWLSIHRLQASNFRSLRKSLEFPLYRVSIGRLNGLGFSSIFI